MQLAGELAAEAKYAAKKCALATKVARATAAAAIRKEPDKYGLAKATDTAVASSVEMHPDLVAAETAQIAAEKEADMAAAVETAFEHRKAALRIEADLYANEYWGRDGVQTAIMAPVENVGRRTAEQQLADLRRGRMRPEPEGDRQ